MFTTAVYGESLIKELKHNDIPLELIHVPSTIWCGSIAVAPNLTEEPDITELLEKYQKNCRFPKQYCVNHDWSCAISINYWQEGKVPRGMVFAQQVATTEQNPIHDTYQMPQSLFVRLACTPQVAQIAFGRDRCEAWELFGIVKEALDDLGYQFAENGA